MRQRQRSLGTEAFEFSSGAYADPFAYGYVGFRTKGKGLHRAWDAIRQELRRTLKAEKIRELQDTLDTIRSELSIRLLNIIR